LIAEKVPHTMATFLQFAGALIFLFCFCYFVAGMANNNASRSGKPTDNLGCAIILFVALILFVVYKALTGG